MKQFRLLGMALLALIMSVGFVACSSSDDDDNNGGGSITSGKKLMSINYDAETINFVYGEDGKLDQTTYIDKYNERYSGSINYSWNGNTITATKKENGRTNSYTIKLQDGKISSTNAIDGYVEAITYSGNYIKEIEGYFSDKYTWENGNITKIDDNINITYYTDKVNKHSSIIDVSVLNLDHASFDLNDLIMAHPNLVGTSNQNLIKSVTYTDTSHDGTANYSYELDKDGYPTKITETDGSDTTVYTLTWK